MLNNADGLEKFLVGWIQRVARSLKKDELVLVNDGTTAANIINALATKTGMKYTLLSGNNIFTDTAMVLGTYTADNFVAARANKRRGGVNADVLPLAGLHESEVAQFAEFLGVEKGEVIKAIPNIDPSEVARAIGITASFLGQADADSFYHMAKLLEKYEVATPEFINVLKEVGKNELETRFRHNGNIPVPNVRQEGLDFLS